MHECVVDRVDMVMLQSRAWQFDRKSAIGPRGHIGAAVKPYFAAGGEPAPKKGKPRARRGFPKWMLG